MLAIFAVLVLCGFVLFLADFIQGFIVDARTSAAVGLTSLGVCALLLVGFFAFCL